MITTDTCVTVSSFLFGWFNRMPQDDFCSPKFRSIVKNAGDYLRHVKEGNTSDARQWSHMMQLLSFISYCCEQNVWDRIREKLDIRELVPLFLSRRQYLAVPCWLLKVGIRKYEINITKEFDNIAHFMVWEDATVTQDIIKFNNLMNDAFSNKIVGRVLTTR